MAKRLQGLTFATDAAIIDRLGRELVAHQETALTELVKNAFDADATSVDIVFQDSGASARLEIRDNGSGMGYEELVDGFLRLAGTLKVAHPTSPRYGRQRAGRKGIGRFSAQRLGRRLVLTTYADGAPQGHQLTIEWDRFTPGETLERIPVQLDEIDPGAAGTTVRIEGLRDEWTEREMRRAWDGILGLQQPFPIAPVIGEPKADPGFAVRILRQGQLLDEETTVADFKTEVLDHLHVTIELEVDAKGRARWRLSRNRFGPTSEWAPIHHEHRDEAKPPAYEHLHDVWMRAYYAIMTPSLFPRLIGTRIRDVVARQGGVRLYRNGFRVVPYGSQGDDWLQLDQLYAKRSLLAPIANRNFFGVVEVHDADGTVFEEHTSREGLIETPGFRELRGLLSSVLVTAALRISEDRGKKGKAGKRSETETGDLRAAVRAAQEAAAAAVTANEPELAKSAASQTATAARLVELERARLADEASVLRFLATLGMTMTEFSHETGMTFEAFRLDFARVFDAALAANPSDADLRAQAARAKAMLARLDNLTAYLNALAGARAARGMHPISLSRSLEDFEKGIRAQAESRRIALTVTAPVYDPLFTRPMHEAEVASVLLNLYTNAVKALLRRGGERAIAVEAVRLEGQDGEQLCLRFADSGDGIPEELRERVFEAFFTTSNAPAASAPDNEHATGAGLGLWIVRQIADNAGGSVEVSAAPSGYVTCIEVRLPAEAKEEQV